MSWRVIKYLPNRLYGFVGTPDHPDVFFHLRVFQPGKPVCSLDQCQSCENCSGCVWAEVPPPPILGEPVEVILEDGEGPQDQALGAKRVLRTASPILVRGVVGTFNDHKGYGFADGDDGISYHLHKSEIQDGRAPSKGQRLIFFAGARQGKPRACHVRVC